MGETLGLPRPGIEDPGSVRTGRMVSGPQKPDRGLRQEVPD